MYHWEESLQLWETLNHYKKQIDCFEEIRESTVAWSGVFLADRNFWKGWSIDGRRDLTRAWFERQWSRKWLSRKPFKTAIFLASVHVFFSISLLFLILCPSCLVIVVASTFRRSLRIIVTNQAFYSKGWYSKRVAFKDDSKWISG